MTSIFGDLYSQNIERVNARSKTDSEDSVRAKSGKTDFKEVLADVEKKAKYKEVLHREKALLAKASSAQEELSKGPIGRGRLLVENIPTAQILPPPVEISLPAENSASVKISSSDVKLTPPKPVLPQLNEAPAAPVILSAKRIEGSKTPSPSLPPTYKVEDIKDIIVTAGKYHGVDPLLGLAVAKVESAYQHDAVSTDGHRSKGVFQLLDSTANHMMNTSGISENYDPFDPGMNAYLGVGYLRRLMDMFSSNTKLGANKQTVAAKSSRELEKLAVAAFNAGEGSVARAQAKAKALGKNPTLFSSVEPHLPVTTREYVQRVSRVKEALGHLSDDIEKA